LPSSQTASAVSAPSSFRSLEPSFLPCSCGRLPGTKLGSSHTLHSVAGWHWCRKALAFRQCPIKTNEVASESSFPTTLLRRIWLARRFESARSGSTESSNRPVHRRCALCGLPLICKTARIYRPLSGPFFNRYMGRITSCAARLKIKFPFTQQLANRR